jgi:hypothetical protein
MFTEAWKFLQNAEHRTVLSWLGGGVVAVISALWAVYIFFHSAPATSPAASKPTAAEIRANCGSVAIGGNVTGATITAGNTPGSDCTTEPRQGSGR